MEISNGRFSLECGDKVVFYPHTFVNYNAEILTVNRLGNVTWKGGERLINVDRVNLPLTLFLNGKQSYKPKVNYTQELTLSPERENELVDEMCEYLDLYHWIYTTDAVRKIIRTWWREKEPVMRRFAGHPNWKPEKFMLVWDNNYTRPVDLHGIKKVMEWAIDYAHSIQEMKKSPYTISYDEASKICQYYYRLKETIASVVGGYTFVTGTIDGFPISLQGLREVRSLYQKYKNIQNDIYENYSDYTEESHDRYIVISNIFRILYDWAIEENFSNLLSEEKANYLNAKAEKIGLDLRAVQGQKITKPLQKILKYIKANETPEWNKMIAVLGDSINPLQFKRHTIISFNPIDYLRMSIMENATSCHNIDKGRVEVTGGQFGDGCHAAGTIAYMLDNSTAIHYTVKSEYTGEDYERQYKVTRCCLSFGDEKNQFVRVGRLYPQDNDSVEGNAMREQIREQVENICSTIWGTVNLWKKHLMRDYHEDFIKSESSAAYPDWEQNYGDGSEILLRNTDFMDNNGIFHKIKVSAQPLCVECGYPHDCNSEINCCHNFKDNGSRFWCAYHQRWEFEDDYIVIENAPFGEDCICRDAYEQGNYYGFEGNYYTYDDDTIDIDGTCFPTWDDAECNGYRYAYDIDEWCTEDDVAYSERYDMDIYTPNYHYVDELDEYLNDDDYELFIDGELTA